jgi:hypothetical protein
LLLELVPSAKVLPQEKIGQSNSIYWKINQKLFAVHAHIGGATEVVGQV